MIRDIGILGGLSIIYFAMVATLIRVALFYRNEQRGDGSAEHLSHGDEHTIGPGRTAPNAMLSPPTKMTPGRIVRRRPNGLTQHRYDTYNGAARHRPVPLVEAPPL